MFVFWHHFFPFFIKSAEAICWTWYLSRFSNNRLREVSLNASIIYSPIELLCSFSCGCIIFLWLVHISAKHYKSYSDVVCLMSISEFFEDCLQANWSLLQKKKLKWRLYKVNQSKEKSILLSRDCIRTPLKRLVPSIWYLWFLLQRETCFENLKWRKETYLKEYSLLSELWVKFMSLLPFNTCYWKPT